MNWSRGTSHQIRIPASQLFLALVAYVTQREKDAFLRNVYWRCSLWKWLRSNETVDVKMCESRCGHSEVTVRNLKTSTREAPQLAWQVWFRWHAY